MLNHLLCHIKAGVVVVEKMCAHERVGGWWFVSTNMKRFVGASGAGQQANYYLEKNMHIYLHPTSNATDPKSNVRTNNCKHIFIPDTQSLSRLPLFLPNHSPPYPHVPEVKAKASTGCFSCHHLSCVCVCVCVCVSERVRAPLYQ